MLIQDQPMTGEAVSAEREVLVNSSTKIKPMIVQRLVDWQYLERSVHRMIAAWGRHFADWDDKSVIHRQIWEQAECVRRLRERIDQFPGGHPDGPVSNRLEVLGNLVLKAPSFQDAVDGIYQILNKALVNAYVAYVQRSHPVHDAPTVRMLHEICTIKEQQWLWYRDFRRRHPHVTNADYRRRILEEVESLGRFQSEIEVVKGQEAKPVGVTTEFRLPKYSARLENWRPKHDIMKYVRCDFATNAETRRFWWAYAYLLEKNLPDDQLRWIYWGHFMPWDFHYDVSRHLWDESRHGDSGYSRLKDFGISIEEVGFPPYQNVDDNKDGKLDLGPGTPLSPRDLYEEVFFIGMVAENGHFEVKNESYADFRDADDMESAEMMLFDIIDETTHVQYAHRWLPVLAQQAGIDNAGYRERAAAERKKHQEAEVQRIAEDSKAPRGAGIPEYEFYQEMLGRIRAKKPMREEVIHRERSLKPM